MHLYKALEEQVEIWRASGYPHENYPTIAEILEFATEPSGAGYRLRAPQISALETYWYIRLIRGTAQIIDLYKSIYRSKAELLAALGVPNEAFALCDYDLDELFRRLRTDAKFASAYNLDALVESITLQYGSYIFALAMGSGKTALIGAIIATEFAMALEYPGHRFVENALVFAPGKTIIESLRELASLPYDHILPSRLHKPFAASFKLTFTQDGSPDVQVIPGSAFNVIVTNTEKIRIQKEAIRKSDLGTLFNVKSNSAAAEAARAEVANRRLKTIASLPNLAIFSDEAHHTYGQALGKDLKKVRMTVDYLYRESPDLICVVNTTGTPYFNRQLLRDVVIWYGLSQGIRDNILKEVTGNVYSYEFDNTQTGDFVSAVIEDFFDTYAEVSLPDGSPARLAMYFPQTDDLDSMRPVIAAKLRDLGYIPEDIILENTTKSSRAEIDAFNRLNDPTSKHRVILLVNKGTEGWNCPSLFACALARRLKHSNNFVLQAASRCLRQVPGNKHSARIYLSRDNEKTLDSQLQETYGEHLRDLRDSYSNRRSLRLVLKKINPPPLIISQTVRTVIPIQAGTAKPLLVSPKTRDATIIKRTFDIVDYESLGGALLQSEAPEQIAISKRSLSAYMTAVDLASTFRVDLWHIYDQLVQLYRQEVPESHIPFLAHQIAEQTRQYDVVEEVVEKAIELVKLDGFTKEEHNGKTEYVAVVNIPIDKEALIMYPQDMGQTYRQGSFGFGFHYEPYNFDSDPEKDLYRQMLLQIQQKPEDIEDIYYSGAITNPHQTEFYVEYRDGDQIRRYSPDFLIRRKNGHCLILEIKSEQFRTAVEEDLDRYERGEAPLHKEGRKAVAVKMLVEYNPEQLEYITLFASESIPQNQLQGLFAHLYT